MLKLLIQQANIDYYGFFATPAFNLMGDSQTILAGLYKTFAPYNLGLGNFKLEGDLSEPSTNAVVVRLGRFGIFRFKFDQVQASLNQFSDEDLAGMVSVIEKGTSWVREAITDLAFKTHAFVYIGHGTLSEGTSRDFLLSLPRRATPILGEDLGSGIVESWHDANLDAKVRLTIDHSLQQQDGLFIN